MNVVEIYVSWFWFKIDKLFDCELIKIVCGVGYWIEVL